jgi:hypothetical protein
MRRDYDIFEQSPDGSIRWRACVTGNFEAQRKIQELTEHSESQFLKIDIHAGELPPFNVVFINSRPVFKRAVNNPGALPRQLP